MKTFQKLDGSLWAFEKDGSQDHLIAEDMIALTKYELDAIQNLKPTAKELQEATNRTARDYLRSTDWYVVRFAETGDPVPQEISTKRAEARLSVIED